MNARLTLRMIAPTAAISLLLLGVGVVTAWYVHSMQRDISYMLEINVSSVRAAEELEISARELRTRVYHYLVTGERQDLERAYQLRPEIDHWLAEATRWSTTEYEQGLMARVSRGLGDSYRALLRPGPPSLREADRLFNRLTDEVVTPTHEYLDFNEQEVEKTCQRNLLYSGRLVFALLLLGTCGPAAGLVAGLGLARAVSRSLVQISVPLKAAAGHLDEVVGPITFVAPWDLTQLGVALRQIADRTGDMVQRLRQSEREALRAEQLAAVGQLAAGMAHELRNPLTSIKILVQAAQARGGEGCLQGRDLGVVEEEITRLEGVIGAFLQFARPPVPEKRPVEARSLIEASIDLVTARARLCHVRIDTGPFTRPLTVVADPGQLRQVLLNLLLNALESVPVGGLVRVEATEEPPGWLRLQVKDNGPGLPGDLGPRIFAPFVSTKETGLGLGLSICKRIVEAHAGAIEANNDPAAGAVFTVRLPLVPAESPGERKHAEPARRR